MSDAEAGLGRLTELTPSLADLFDRFLRGDRRALARAISLVEDEAPGFQSLMHAVVTSRPPAAHRVGITGPPGAGKSTLISALADRYRRRGDEVAVLAVDPTSLRTGGAILGDRIRMGPASEAGVFLRSMASRGSDGGLAAATLEVLDLLDRFGFSHILIETLGAGQSQMAVGWASDSVVLVLVPEAGDDIQAMKSGTMEIADIFVVNKADRPGAERMVSDIEAMLEIRREVGAATSSWDPSVLLVQADEREGVDELAAEIARHERVLRETGALEARRRARVEAQVDEVLAREVRRAIGRVAPDARRLAAERIRGGQATPYSIAAELLHEVKFE